jgi:PAS domain S-box-containing protein
LFRSASPLEPAHWYQVALTSIGDAVVVTDAQGRVLFMNPVAEALTGWPQAEAVGRPLAEAFRIVNEFTRRPVADPVAEVFARGGVVGLANHTLLIARDGSERPIEDSAAPIRGGGGIEGAVLVFRDASARRRAEVAAADALAYAEGIVDTVREPLVVLDSALRVQTANRSFYQTFAASPEATEGQLLYELGGRQWDLPRLRELLESVLPRDSQFNDFEVDHEFASLGHRTMLLNARRLDRRGGGGDGFILLAIEDVTGQRAAASALAASETRYRRLFETAQDGILLLDGDTGRIFDANPFLTELLGYGHDELVGKELWEIGLFDHADASRAAFGTLQREGYVRYEDLPLQTKAGRGIDVEFVSNVYQVNGKRVIQCNVRDVTDRKRAEEALRQAHDQLEARVDERTAELARLNEALTAEVAGHRQAETARLEVLRRLATAQEAERHRLARELHDQMGQHLTALGLGLKASRDATPEASPAAAILRQLQDLSDLMGREVHQLALELRPTALDDLGLHTALENYVESWSEQSRVEADFQSAGMDGARLPAAIETALFRVVQEALTNVRKHAQCKRVSVILRRAPLEALAVVEDDGRGFDAEAPPAGRLGLLGMGERLALVGGTLVVESAPEKGTTVFARVPLSEGSRQ